MKKIDVPIQDANIVAPKTKEEREAEMKAQVAEG